MNNKSNAEKQARFRKKEELRRLSARFFREWQAVDIHGRNQPAHVLKLLNDAADLPSGWTDEQYEWATQKLYQIRLDLIGSRDQVENDVHEGMNVEQDFMKVPDPAKWMADVESAVNDARGLAAHLISSLELSRCNDAGKAAALMEALRFLGRSMSSSLNVPRSDATTVCLAALPNHYTRPAWFAPDLAQWLNYQLDDNLVRDLSDQLSELGDMSIL
jgi:hypothetical protein